MRSPGTRKVENMNHKGDNRLPIEDELYEHRTDADEWSEEPSDVAVRSTSTVVSFRLSRPEMDRVEAAVRQSGESLSSFMRRAIACELGEMQARPSSVEFAGGYGVTATEGTGPSVIFESTIPAVFEWDDQEISVPDFPPLTVTF